MAAPPIVKGEPGETYTNNTDKVLFQFVCFFSGSCGQCISLAGQVGPYWPIPIHHGCNCQNLPIPPGTTANPFVDYRAEVEKLPAPQQSRVMGASNYALVKTGVVEWGDVVTRARIRPLKEIVAKHKLTVEQMTAAGVKPYQATKAYTAVHTPERAAQDAAQRKAIRALKDAGATPEAIVAGTSGRVLRRVTGPASPPLGGRQPQPLGGDDLEWAAGYLGIDLHP